VESGKIARAKEVEVARKRSDTFLRAREGGRRRGRERYVSSHVSHLKNTADRSRGGAKENKLHIISHGQRAKPRMAAKRGEHQRSQKKI